MLAETYLLAALGIVPDVLIAAEDVASGKPSPEGYPRAVVGLGGDSRAAWIGVEDAPVGIEAIIRGGGYAAAVATTSHRSDLAKAKRTWNDLRGFVEDVRKGHIQIGQGKLRCLTELSSEEWRCVRRGKRPSDTELNRYAGTRWGML